MENNQNGHLGIRNYRIAPKEVALPPCRCVDNMNIDVIILCPGFGIAPTAALFCKALPLWRDGPHLAIHGAKHITTHQIKYLVFTGDSVFF